MFKPLSFFQLIATPVMLPCFVHAIAAGSYPESAPWPLQDKTLVAWVSPANLTQSGGSVLSLQQSGALFDAIVNRDRRTTINREGQSSVTYALDEPASFPRQRAFSCEGSRLHF